MTSDSMNATPSNMVMRTGPAAPGLRPMLVHAEATAFPCPNAPANAATPRTSAAAMNFHASRMPDAPAPPSSAARTGAARLSRTSPIITTSIFFLISFPPSRVCPFLVLLGYGSGDVDRGQHDEDERLDEGPEDPQAHHRGNEKRQDHKEHAGGRVLAEDVAEQAQRERKHARQVRDDLDRHHQREEPPDRPHELFGVLDRTQSAQPHDVVEQERRQRQGERRARVRRWRLQEEDQPERVRDEDEEGEGHHKRHEIPAAAMPDDVLREVRQTREQQFERLLLSGLSNLSEDVV